MRTYDRETKDGGQGKVGLFFYVRGVILADSYDLDNAEDYGDFKIGETSHDKVWEARYHKKYLKAYDYYPRGRVVYNWKKSRYTLYVDKCIDDEGIKKLIEFFNLEKANYVIDRADPHYVCRGCNAEYIEI